MRLSIDMRSVGRATARFAFRFQGKTDEDFERLFHLWLEHGRVE